MLRKKFQDKELQDLQEFAKNYTVFMTLGTATQADATSQSKSDTGSYMAHMYGLLLPNEYLKDLNIPLGDEAKQYIKPNLKVMIGEGTGYVYPDQTIQDQDIKCQTAIGRNFTDEMINYTKGAKRFIRSPATPENKRVVAEFYKHVVTAASVDPEMGLIEFRNQKVNSVLLLTMSFIKTRTMLWLRRYQEPLFQI